MSKVPRRQSFPSTELKLDLIQTQMTQKPVLRAEVYARSLRASQNLKEDSVERAGSIILPSPSKVETVHEIILKPDLSRFSICFCIEKITQLFSLLGTPRQEPPHPVIRAALDSCMIYGENFRYGFSCFEASSMLR
jgi:hypothetical protein